MEIRIKVARIAIVTVWLGLVCLALSILWNYAHTAGHDLAPPSRWPPDSSIPGNNTGFTLVMAVHPHCPCSRASIGELARLMAQVEGRITVFVLFVKSRGAGLGWEKTDLWPRASLIPGVTVMVDDDGIEARRFHALTSGATALYDKDGRLMFSGGITAARGHEGDNFGRAAIVSLLTKGSAEDNHTPVFGCSLLAMIIACKMSPRKHETPLLI